MREKFHGRALTRENFQPWKYKTGVSNGIHVCTYVIVYMLVAQDQWLISPFMIIEVCI